MGFKVLADWARYVVSPFAIFGFVAGAVMTTVTGPFGTYLSMSLVERAAYWCSLIGASIILALTLKRFVDKRWVNRGFWVRSSITTATFSVLFTGFIVLANRIAFGANNPADMSLLWIFSIVLAVPVTVNPIIYFVLKMNGEEPNETGPTLPRLFNRLPEPKVGKLLRVSVEDHYVNVTTERGSERLLMRFADALEELDASAGLQVHRSHWVAHDAVRGYWMDGSRTLLELADGSQVPVSRNYRQQALDAGLLANETVRPTDGSAGLRSA